MSHLSLNKTKVAVLSALFSAILYALCVPCAKILGKHVESAIMGGLLYLGAGSGLLLTALFKKGKANLSLTKTEAPYAAAMVLLDITAIILLMFGVSRTSGANVALLGNFELVATSVAAFSFFKEFVSIRLFCAIILITLASIVLSFEGAGSFIFNAGSILVLLSCVCWGIENNCTRMMSSKDTRQITIIKGCFSGAGGLIIAFLLGESLPQIKWLILTLLLGFVSYGISVSLYIYAQRFLGAAKTGAYYSVAPFFGVLISMIFLGERPDMKFYISLLIMLAASILVVRDTQNS